MGYSIGTLAKGGGDDTHYQVLAIIKTLAESEGWVSERYVSTGSDRELILSSVGLSGTEEIYIGFKSYQSAGADYYNLKCAVFTGFVTGNTFETQPGVRIMGCPAHNNAMDYFISANPQRIGGCFKVGTPVYEHFYLGKFFPYARPGEFPAPLVCASMFDGAEVKRYSDTNQQFPYPGNYYDTSDCHLEIRDLSGNWVEVWSYPWTNKNTTSYVLAGSASSSSSPCLVPADADGTFYQMEPIIVSQLSTASTPSNVYGELDGIFFCSGFNNGVENVVQVGGTEVDQTGLTVLQAVDAIIAAGGRAFVMLQNVYRTNFNDFIALEMN